MTASSQDFDRLIAVAEKKASSFDSAGLMQATQALEHYVRSADTIERLDRRDMQRMHERMVAFHQLCGFLRDTLRQVLQNAVGQQHSMPTYGPQVSRHTFVETQGVLKRYI